MVIAKKLIRNTAYIFISGIATKLFAFAVIAYAARVLGPSGLGVYALMMTFGFLLSFFVNFGILPLGVRELSINRDKAADLFNDILSLRMILIIVLYILLLIIVPRLSYSQNVKYLIYIMGLSAIFSTFSGSFRMLFMGFERMEIPSIIDTLLSIFSAASNIAVLSLGYGLRGMVSVHLVVSILAAAVFGLWVWQRLFRYKFQFRPFIWLNLLKRSLPFFAISAVNQLGTHINIFLLSQLRGPYPGTIAMGYFKPASSLGKVAVNLPMSFRVAALPTIATFRESPDLIRTTIDKSAKYLLLFAFPLVFASTFFPKEIISILFGPEYIPGAPALTVLAWMYALQAFNSPVTATLQSSQHIHRFVPWAILITSVNLLLAFILIPYLSFLGTAIALLVSRVIGLMARFSLLHSLFTIRFFDLKESNRTAVISLLGMLFFSILNFLGMNHVMFLLLAIFLFPLSLFLFHVLHRNELSTLINYFRY